MKSVRNANFNSNWSSEKVWPVRISEEVTSEKNESDKLCEPALARKQETKIDG